MHAGGWAAGFRPLDYFKLTSLVAFILVAIALFFLERAEHTFFDSIERDQNALFMQAQADLVREQKSAARTSLLMEHEAGHLTLATLLANSLWDSHFAPLVAAAQKVPMDECRALARAELERAPEEPSRSQRCFAALGHGIMALPGFAQVDAAVHAMMKGSTVFKIKVYDRRGLTVYSSELGQIGQDKAGNAGWQLAFAGKPASELVHRDRFGAFEGVVENRDLIQSYVPVVGNSKQVTGVFEIYSDVTPLLKHIDTVSQKIARVAAASQQKVDAASLENGRKVEANSHLHFSILFALLLALYLALYLLARNGQRIIDEQARTREASARREQMWHHEKMAALATMAANASHEIGNPLAIISGLAEDIVRAQEAGESVAGHAHEMLAQTTRIAGMTRRITMFASARSETAEPVDLNEMIRAVCEFLSFDTRYNSIRFETALPDSLPPCVAIPDHLNEVLMSLLQAQAEASLGTTALGSVVRVRSEAHGADVMIRISCECAPAAAACLPESDARVESARRRVQGMGGRFVASDGALEIFLPCFEPPQAKDSATAQLCIH